MERGVLVHGLRCFFFCIDWYVKCYDCTFKKYFIIKRPNANSNAKFQKTQTLKINNHNVLDFHHIFAQNLLVDEESTEHVFILYKINIFLWGRNFVLGHI